MDSPATVPEGGPPQSEGDNRDAPPALEALPACLLAWVFPGAGHAAIGHIGRAAIFASVVMGLFLGGLALGGKVYRPVEGRPLSYVAALGGSGVGGPFLIAHLSGASDGDLLGAYHEYGNTFTLVAGLLNLLIVLDAYDLAFASASKRQAVALESGRADESTGDGEGAAATEAPPSSDLA